MSEKYFLGAMTQNGFSTEFGKIMADKEYFTFILKGGAGTGKSSLMKKIAAEFEPTEDVTRFYCSSDPASLDAIVLHTSKAIICDGTASEISFTVCDWITPRITSVSFASFAFKVSLTSL